MSFRLYFSKKVLIALLSSIRKRNDKTTCASEILLIFAVTRLYSAPVNSILKSGIGIFLNSISGSEYFSVVCLLDKLPR